MYFFFFFFFQAEDGIRDHCVTGVQTCALPIWRRGVRVRQREVGARGRGRAVCDREARGVAGRVRGVRRRRGLSAARALDRRGPCVARGVEGDGAGVLAQGRRPLAAAGLSPLGRARVRGRDDPRERVRGRGVRAVGGTTPADGGRVGGRG